MELDDLKLIWKRNDLFERKNTAEIEGMLNGSSQSIVFKLKRNVWFELVLTIVTGLVMMYFAFTLQSGALKWSIVSVLAMLLAYIIYFVKKINLLNRFDPENQNIRESVEKLVADLNTYLRFYKRSYTILYPVYFLLGVLFGAIENGMDVFLHKLTEPGTIIRLGIIALVFMVTSLFITNWYLKKLYGNHLEKLNTLLRDIHNLSA